VNAALFYDDLVAGSDRGRFCANWGMLRGLTLKSNA
jgi:hypothetical protein